MRMGRRAPCVCPVSYIARPLRKIRMEAFLVSTGAVLLGEIGDKTMLLALVLATRFRKPMPVIAGIVVHRVQPCARRSGRWLAACRDLGRVSDRKSTRLNSSH